jgi:integrase
MKRNPQYANVRDRWTRRDGSRSGEFGQRPLSRYLVEYVKGDRPTREGFARADKAHARARELNNLHEVLGALGSDESFESYSTRYYAAKRHAPTSAERCGIYNRLHIFPWIGAVPLSTLDGRDGPRIIQDMVDQWAAPHPALPGGKPRGALSFKTQDGLLREVTAVFNQAKRDGLMVRNPAREAVPSVEDTTSQEVLTPDEMRAIIDAADDRFRLLFELSAHTGLRISELLGLRHDDFAWVGELFVVTAQWQLNKYWATGPLLVPLKAARRPGQAVGASGFKRLALPGWFADSLLAYREEHGPGPDGLVFRGVRTPHTPMTQSTAAKQWDWTSQRALGRKTKRRWHNARYFVAASMVADGQNSGAIARQLGNTAAVVERSYAYQFAQIETAGAAAAGKALTAPKRPTRRHLRAV